MQDILRFCGPFLLMLLLKETRQCMVINVHGQRPRPALRRLLGCLRFQCVNLSDQTVKRQFCPFLGKTSSLRLPEEQPEVYSQGALGVSRQAEHGGGNGRNCRVKNGRPSITDKSLSFYMASQMMLCCHRESLICSHPFILAMTQPLRTEALPCGNRPQRWEADIPTAS